MDLPVETAVQLMTNEAELKKISTQAQGQLMEQSKVLEAKE